MRKFLSQNKIVYFLGVLIVVLGVMCAANYGLSRRFLSEDIDKEENKKYKYHIAMINGDDSDIFWNDVYAGAVNAGKEYNIYIENWGTNLEDDYSVEELLDMAVACKVDGILIEPGEDNRITETIDRADDAGIPVISMENDLPNSKRKSFVTANDYVLGELYGQEVLNAAEELPKEESSKVAVLIGLNEQNSAPYLIYSGISETLGNTGRNIELSNITRTGKGGFESEEKIRKLLLNPDKRPDILVCLSVTDTISAYQCVIDYNLVGKVQIIGYYATPKILEGIEKGVIRSTVAIDAEEMGSEAVKGMSEYLRSKYISEYLSVSSELVTKDNLNKYVREDE